MQLINNSLNVKLQEIAELKTEIKLQEERYISLLKADEPFFTLKDIRLIIKHLNEELTAKEEQVKKDFESVHTN